MKVEYLRRAFVEAGYKEEIEELLLFADFHSADRSRLAFSCNNKTAFNSLDEWEYLKALESFSNDLTFWGKMWLTDKTFFLFEGYDWKHIDVTVPDELDPDGLFLS